MEELINELYKKQSEIGTDVESLVMDEIELNFQNEHYALGYEDGFWQGIERAVDIVRENEHLFKKENNMFQVINEKGIILGKFYSLYLATVFVEHLKNNHNTIATIQEI